MCVSPIRIPNPNYGNKTPIIVKTKDTVSRYLNIPCGVCAECLAKRQMDLVQRARNMSLDYYLFFCTLTYDNKHLPSITTSTGFDISFADISDVQKMIKRIRKNNLFKREFKFFFVSERGKEKGRPHFHGLIFLKKYQDDDKLFPAQIEPYLRSVLFKEWRRNTAWTFSKKKGVPILNTRKPVYEPLFKYHEKYVGGKLYKNFDLHYVTPHTTENGSDDVSFYVTKYLLKPSDKERRLQQALRLNLSKEEYEDIWSLVKSRCLCSKAFGDATFEQMEHVVRGIELSQDDPTGLKYFIPNGNPQPLAHFYRKYVLPSHALRSVKAVGSPIFDSDRSQSELDQSVIRGDIIQSQVSRRDISELF